MAHEMGDAPAGGDAMSMDMDMSPMYFHTTPTKNLVLLFGGWRPKDMISYMLSLTVLFLLAILSEWLKHRAPSHLKDVFGSKDVPAEGPAAAEAPKAPVVLSGGTTYYAAKFWLAAVRIALHFLLMLAVMSFDVGVFVAVVLGLSLGYVRFATDGTNPSTETQSSSTKA